jgi:ribonuclease HI
MNETKHVIIYTDGACIGNPGPGGYGVVMIYGSHRKEFSGGFRLTTNNRMEIFAAIAGLSALKSKCNVTIYSDSQYLVDAMQKGWVTRWQRNNWWRTKSEPARNIDLWERLLDLCAQHEVTFVWIKGHANHTENERCDLLSNIAATAADLPVDEHYESPKSPGAKPKLSEEGQPCRKCSTPVVRRLSRKKPGRLQISYLFCPSCHATYNIEGVDQEQSSSLSHGANLALFDLV